MPDVIVGARLEADASGAINNVKNFKQELKLAQAEVVTLSEKFGATSKEAAAAAMKAAELKDQIGDAAQLVDAFNPDTKFRAVASSIQTVVGGFTALTGAMGLLGVESEEVQKTLLKVQSALALSQGISQLSEGIGAIKNLGSVLVNTLGRSGLIGIAIAGVAALGAAFLGVFNSSKKLTEQQKALNELTKEAASLYSSERGELEKNKRSLESENVSRGEKEKIIKNIQQQYPGYFKNLDIESGKVVGLAEDYAAVVKVIELKARATAASNLLAKQEQELLDLGFQYGITSEEDAEKFLSKLEGSDSIINRAILSRAKTIKERRAFLQKIQAEAEQALTSSNRGTGTTTGTAAGGKTVKDEERESELDKEKRWQAEYDNIQFNAEQARKQQKAISDEEERLAEIARLDELSRINVEFTNEQIDLGWVAVENKRLQHEATMALIQEGSNVLTAASQLLGEETAAGKVLAVASATISTYLAINKTLAAYAGKPIPGYAIAQAIATGLFGLVQVKKILSVPIPKRGGGGGSAGSVPSGAAAPLSPQLPQSTQTRLDRDQLNQIGNAAVRAFVVETDVTTNQERIRRLSRAARLG